MLTTLDIRVTLVIVCITRQVLTDVHINFHTDLSDGRLPELESVYFPYVESHTAFNFLSTFFRLRIVPVHTVNKLLSNNNVLKSHQAMSLMRPSSPW